MMDCLDACYLPRPPRAWSRVQHDCSTTTTTTTVSSTSAAMKIKGNVLQYKANSSNLTMAQRYSYLTLVNRNTTWATQSLNGGITNPNTKSLKRVGNVENLAIDPITGQIIGTTNDPITCPTAPPAPHYDDLPSNRSATGQPEPTIPPVVSPSPSSNVFPPIIAIPAVLPLVIADGGSLLCSVQENPCTGKTVIQPASSRCFPTTDSDVPGTIQELCWDDGTPTWFPRTQTVMTNSANKWPVNAILQGAILLFPPTLLSVDTNIDTQITTLVWENNHPQCLLVGSYQLFQNGVLVSTDISGKDTSVSFYRGSTVSATYFLVAVNTTAKTQSVPSNSLTG